MRNTFMEKAPSFGYFKFLPLNSSSQSVFLGASSVREQVGNADSPFFFFWSSLEAPEILVPPRN